MLPIGPIALLILVVLVGFGLADRALSHLRLPFRSALLLAIAMLVGAMFDLDLAPGLSINVGAGILPIGLALYLLFTPASHTETARAVSATLLTAASVYLVGRWFPPGAPTELNLFAFDAQHIYGLIGGLGAYTAARSPRPAFAAAVLGIAVADVVQYITLMAEASQGDLVLQIGGGGFWATAMIAGCLAVMLAEFLGETQVKQCG